MKVTVDKSLIEQAMEAHRAMREWIKAVPEPTIAMPGTDGDWLDDVDGMLSKALAEPAVEPVAYRYKYLNFMGDEVWSQDLPRNGKVLETQALYASPPADVPLLSIDEIHAEASRYWSEDGVDHVLFARGIEQLIRRKAGL